MKVALLGNMNNMLFALTRFLRDAGVDAELLLFDNEMEHFHPAADTFDFGYRDYCRKLAWGDNLRLRVTPPAQVAADLSSYDVLIGCGSAPAYCALAGRHLDVFKPYGADIGDLVQYRWSLFYPAYSLAQATGVRLQRRGIADSRVFHMDANNAIYERQYEALKGDCQRWTLGFPFIHTGTYDPESFAETARRTHWWHEFERVRRTSELLLVYHGRHVWTCGEDDPNHKGTDRLLKGFAELCRRRPALKAALVTLEYGPDQAASRKLAAELGIADRVHWFPRMLRKDLMAGIHYADVVCGQFSRSWITYGSIYEAMAMAKPVLGFRDDASYHGSHGELYPMLNAREPAEIAAALERAADDPTGMASMGRQARAWYQTRVVAPVLERYLAYISSQAAIPRAEPH